MTEAKRFMDEFMVKLGSGGFAKDIQPNNGPELDDAFVEEQLSSYKELVNSGILEQVINN